MNTYCINIFVDILIRNSIGFILYYFKYLNELRTGCKYVARCLTWYLQNENLSNEDFQYLTSSNQSSSWEVKHFLNKKIKYKF